MIIKLAIIVIIFAVIIIYLKNINKELSILATVCACAIIVMTSIDMLMEVFSLYEKLSKLGGISGTSLKIIIKVTLIAYVVEFSAGIVEDFGLKSLADKLVVAGKIIIVLLAYPIFEALIGIVEVLL